MILMLKKLVIIGSLLAIGPMLAGCMSKSSIENANRNAYYLALYARYSTQVLCRMKQEKINLNMSLMSIETTLSSRGETCVQAEKGQESYSGYSTNRSKSELCQMANWGGAYKEKAKQILRNKGLSCDDEQQRLAEAQRARQAAIEKKKEMMLNAKQKRSVRLKSVVKLKPNVRLMPLRNLSYIALDPGQAFPLVEMA